MVETLKLWAVLRGVLRQYKEIRTLPYESVSLMHKSVWVVEYRKRLSLNMSMMVDGFNSIEINTS